jgi:hypothetical protein
MCLDTVGKKRAARNREDAVGGTLVAYRRMIWCVS